MTNLLRFHRTSDPRIDEARIAGETGAFTRSIEDETADQANVVELTQRIETLVNLTGEFRREVLDRPVKWTTEIRDLGDEELGLAEPATILLEEYPGDDVVIARFPELEIFGEGISDAEAIFHLKQAILDLYDELEGTDPGQLGDLPSGWLRVVKSIIVEA